MHSPRQTRSDGIQNRKGSFLWFQVTPGTRVNQTPSDGRGGKWWGEECPNSCSRLLGNITTNNDKRLWPDSAKVVWKGFLDMSDIFTKHCLLKREGSLFEALCISKDKTTFHGGLWPGSMANRKWSMWKACDCRGFLFNWFHSPALALTHTDSDYSAQVLN